MSYEFNTEDSHWSLPNPFRLENIFLFATALVLLGGGIQTVFTAKNFVTQNETTSGVAAMALAIILLSGALKFGIQSLSQLRFFFGRQFPIGLADELPATATGESVSSAEVREIMRQRAIIFPEPTGPLNGLLYTMIKPLITCAPTIQAAAVQHFHSLVSMLILLGSLIVSFVVLQGTPHEGMISWMYLPITGLSLLTPFIERKETDPVQNSKKMMAKAIGLIGFAILGPVLIPKYLPAYPIPPMWIAPALLLVCSMIASGLFMASLLSQMDETKQTGVSCEQTTIAMNCPPSQLWTEIGRDFQNNWTRNIPNRAYMNVPPDVTSTDRGSFNGQILEESQPMPSKTMAFTMREAWQESYVSYLMILSIWGLALACMSTAAAIYYVPDFATMGEMEISRVFLIVIALGVVTVLSFKIAHLLWSRMYFRSRLVWIEATGTFQTSTLSIGNDMTSKTKSSSTLTRVEDATLRVWAADIVSVAFGKENSRFIMHMTPIDGYAKSMADRLINFAADQSSIATPTSVRDLDKMNAMMAMDKTLSAGNNASELMNQLAPPKHKATEPLIASNAAAKEGIVKFYNTERKFGIVISKDGIERYFNANQLKSSVVTNGDKVRFEPASTTRGPIANAVVRM